jgi:cytochrome P450
MLEKLPLLNAVIKESLRLRITKPVSNPRLTPHGTEIEIESYKLPSGVRMNTFPWSVHQNEDVFYRAREWIPERWMETPDSLEAPRGPGPIQADGRAFWAFGSGSRMCTGVNLAMESQ